MKNPINRCFILNRKLDFDPITKNLISKENQATENVIPFENSFTFHFHGTVGKVINLKTDIKVT